MIQFNSPIEDITVYGLSKMFGVPDVDLDIRKINAYVDWNLEHEARSWGIKSTSIYITKVVCLFEWETYADDLIEEEKAKLITAGGKEYRGNTISGTIEIVSNKKWNEKEWTISNNISFRGTGLCCPQEIEINFELMEIIVF